MKKTTAQYGRNTVGALAGLTMVVSMAAAPALASEPADQTANTKDAQTQTTKTTVANTQVTAAVVEGSFAYDQSTITPNTEIARFFQQVSQSICGATPNFITANPLGWQLSVSGNVKNAFTASVSDLASEDSVNKVMTCTCGGNPAGGRAIITADVKGIPVEKMLSRAGIDSSANTLTFISTDGTEMAFPLSYIVGRHAVLSYEINGEDLSASVGGNNQLWMMKTPANYFVRDIVEIKVSTEEVVPATPGATDEHPNSPNVGVLAGTQG